jgi:uncharacterized protein YfaS (alpha-2-macroglobulin family)
MGDLKYPRDIREYLKPLTQLKVGQLITVEYRIILGEDRDYVAMESFVPAGTEVVNTRLATESLATVSNAPTAEVSASVPYAQTSPREGSSPLTKPFTTEDFRDDRYFGYAHTL